MTSLCSDQLRESSPALPHLRTHFRTRIQPVRALLRTVSLWQARNQTRTKLRSMPDYLLRDIGLSVEEVIEETRKPFWMP